VDQKYKPYKNTVTLLTNKVIDNEWVFDHIAFYNFFQKYVGFGSSDKSLIDKDLIDLSRKAYFSVFEILKPNLVIAWGKGDLYYKYVPQDDWDPLIEEVIEKKMFYKYKKKYNDINIWHIKHPSGRGGRGGFDLHEETVSFSKICKHLGYSFPIEFNLNENI
jgi:hypothetical protein